MLLLPGNARRPSGGRGDGACSAQRGLRAGRISQHDDGDGLEPGHALIGRISDGS